MGIQEGLALKSYMDALPQQQEEARLRAQLFKGQADHLDAQNQLLQMETQRQQLFMQGLPAALGTASGPSPPQTSLPPDLAAQPAGTTPGAPTIGQLHSTEAFAQPDPLTELHQQFVDSKQYYATPGLEKNLGDLQALTGLAMRAGMTKDAAAYQQSLLEAQKVQATQRTQQLQDEGAFYARLDALVPDIPANAEKKAMLRKAKAAITFQLGKVSDAMEMLGGKIVPLQPAGTLMRAPAEGGAAVPIGQSPLGLADVEAEKTRGTQRAKLEPMGGSRGMAAPRMRPSQGAAESTAPVVDEITQLTAQLKQADPSLTEEGAARMAVTVLKAVAPASPASAAPAGESFVAQEARVKSEAETRAKGLQPSNPANPVITQETTLKLQSTEIPREAAEQLGVPVGTTYGQLEAGKVTPESGSQVPKQLPGSKEREDVASYDTTLENAQSLLTMIEKDPKASELLGGFLLNPAAAFKRTMSRMGASADPEARRFLATYGVTAALLRAKLIGLAQTNREMSGLTDFVPGPEAGPDAIKAGLKAIIEVTTRTRANLIKNQAGLGVKTPRGTQGDTAAPSPAAPPETPQQLLERLKAKHLGAK